MANWQSIQSLRIKMKFTPSGVYQSLITKTFRIRVFLFVQSLSLDATEESNEMNLLFNPIDGKSTIGMAMGQGGGRDAYSISHPILQ